MPGIYVHIPFCRKACNYCDFYFSTSLKNKSQVINAITDEIDLRYNYLNISEITSVYFGGGTPSLLTGEEIDLMMSALQRRFHFNDKIEITLEANPDNISKNSLQQWSKSGINRLSIGLQSFNDDELAWMNRTHRANDSTGAVKMAQDHGFDNISVDLIYGSRYQDQLSWEGTLNTAVALEVQHISAYNLTIESNTLLGKKFAGGAEPAVSDELSASQFILMHDLLSGQGFEHYEVSNFARNKNYSAHNSSYWKGEHYLGIGPSAHSYNGHSRQWNVRNNNVYIREISSGGKFFDTEELSDKERFNEYVLTRLRTFRGCDTAEIGWRFGEDAKRRFENGIRKYKDFYSESSGVVTLNLQGMLRADAIASDLFLV